MIHMEARNMPRPGANTHAGKQIRARWKAIYAACRLSEQGYTLAQFLKNPWSVLTAIGQESAPGAIDAGFEPLLPAQARIARRLRGQERDSAANDSPPRTTKNEGV